MRGWLQIEMRRKVNNGSIEGGNGRMMAGVILSRLRSALHTKKLSPRNSFR